jgi:hypothetical protein
MQDASLGCGLGGYTTSDKFQKPRTERKAGRYFYEGMLPGHDVRFSIEAVPEGEGIRVTLTRDGQWPEQAAGWCAFQFLLPISRYGGTTALVDGKPLVLPAEKPANNTIVSGAKRLVFTQDDPRSHLELASESGILVTDGRRWSTPSYQLSIGLAGSPHAQASFTLRFPEGSPEQLKPRLCASRLGYSAHGLKEVTMEWPKGMPRPADAVRIEDAAGKPVASGRFGPTITLAYMQNEFAVFGFDDITTPGTYKVVWDAGDSREIRIKPTIYEDAVWLPTLETFIPWQMCHAHVTFADGRLPELPACDMDDGQRVPANFPGIDGFRSYECNLTPYKEGDMIPCGIGGWHDAGDYDLNVHAQAHSVWKLALTYEEFGINHDAMTLDLERQNVVVGKPDGIPDILQQVQWGARWLLCMQQKDGLVYPGVCGRPDGQYNADVLPEKLSDGKPGTKDERHVYVDYQPDSQLAQVVALAAAGRVLKKIDAPLAVRCIAAAEQAYAYYRKAPDLCRPNIYFEKRPEDGKVGSVAAALAELYLTTGKAAYLAELEGLVPELDALKVTWPAAYNSGCGGWWYAPSTLARLVPRLGEGKLLASIKGLCQRAAKEQVWEASPRPWPFQWWHLLDWGASSYSVCRVFDAYWIEKAVPGTFKLEQTQREMLWIYGYHPLSDAIFVCGLDAAASPRYLYNGRLHGRYGQAAASVPGALVGGMSGSPGTGMVAYNDVPGNYYHNEAAIYMAVDYLFAVHALKAAGY